MNNDIQQIYESSVDLIESSKLNVASKNTKFLLELLDYSLKNTTDPNKLSYINDLYNTIIQLAIVFVSKRKYEEACDFIRDFLKIVASYNGSKGNEVNYRVSMTSFFRELFIQLSRENDYGQHHDQGYTYLIAKTLDPLLGEDVNRSFSVYISWYYFSIRNSKLDNDEKKEIIIKFIRSLFQIEYYSYVDTPSSIRNYEHAITGIVCSMIKDNRKEELEFLFEHGNSSYGYSNYNFRKIMTSGLVYSYYLMMEELYHEKEKLKKLLESKLFEEINRLVFREYDGLWEYAGDILFFLKDREIMNELEAKFMLMESTVDEFILFSAISDRNRRKVARMFESNKVERLLEHVYIHYYENGVIKDHVVSDYKLYCSLFHEEILDYEDKLEIFREMLDPIFKDRYIRDLREKYRNLTLKIVPDMINSLNSSVGSFILEHELLQNDDDSFKPIRSFEFDSKPYITLHTETYGGENEFEFEIDFFKDKITENLLRGLIQNNAITTSDKKHFNKNYKLYCNYLDLILRNRNLQPNYLIARFNDIGYYFRTEHSNEMINRINEKLSGLRFIESNIHSFMVLLSSKLFRANIESVSFSFRELNLEKVDWTSFSDGKGFYKVPVGNGNYVTATKQEAEELIGMKKFHIEASIKFKYKLANEVVGNLLTFSR